MGAVRIVDLLGPPWAQRSPQIDRPCRGTSLEASLGGVLACATKIPFMPSTPSPAAAGHDKLRMLVTAEDIDRPERLREPYGGQIEFIEAGNGWW